MRKLFVLFSVLLLASFCYAEPIMITGDVTGNPVTPTQSGRSFTTAQTDVGVSAIALGATPSVARLLLKPHASNKGMIYVGNSAVTSTTGLELATATVTMLDINTVSGLYAISTTANQKVTVMTIIK